MTEHYLNKRIARYISTIFASIAIIMLVWTVCVNENLPPVGLETAQIFYLLFAASTAALSALIAVICNGGTKLQLNIIDGLVIVIAIYTVISALLAGANQKMLLVKVTLLFSVYTSIKILITANNKVIHIIIILFLLLGIYQCALSAMQLFGNTSSNHGIFTITGSFHNPGPLGGFLAMIWGLALYNILKKESSNWWCKTINILMPFKYFMKKKLLFGALGALFLGAGIFTATNLQEKEQISDLTLANIEAITNTDDRDQKVQIDCLPADITCPVKVILADGSKGTIDAEGLRPSK